MTVDLTRERYGPWAIIAGASEGIGAAFSRRLAAQGIDLVLGEALWAEWREHGVDVLSLVVGATDTPALRRILAAHGTTLDDLDDPDDVARQGLENLANGPT